MLSGEPITLNAELGWDFTSAQDTRRVVVLYFGGAELIELEPIRESRAGHGDDSSFYESEERSIVQETVVAWLKEKWGL
jgi:hypothetical protein